MSIEELRKQWVGKYVRTDRELTREEFAKWEDPFIIDEWYPGYKFGGAGVVVDFKCRDEKIWLETDDGFSWVIDDQTVITSAMPDARELAMWFHEAYERLATVFQYETREAPAKPWTQVPKNNRDLLVAVSREILRKLGSDE